MNTPLLKRNRTSSQHSITPGEEEEEQYGTYYRYPSSFQPGHFSSLEKLMFFVSSVLLILLFIFVGLYARSSTHNPSVTLPTPLPSPQVCSLPACIQTAARLLKDVHQDLSPCQDFYAYVCQSWIDRHPLPAAIERLDPARQATERMHYRLHQLLTRPVRTSHLPSPDRILDRQLFFQLEQFYQSCLHQPGDPHDLYPLFRLIQNKTTRVQQLASYGVWTLFRPEVGPDRERPDRTAVYLHPPPRLQRHGYLEGMTAMLRLLFENDHEFGWRTWSAMATARRIVEFEAGRIETSAWTRWDLPALQRELPEIAWSSLFERDAIVWVQANVLARIKTQAGLQQNRAFETYLLWRTLWTFADSLGPAFLSIRDRMLGNPSRPRWQVCIDRVQQSSLGPLLGRYYLLDRSPQDRSRLHQAAEHALRQLEPLLALGRIHIEVGYSTLSRLDLLDLLSLTQAFGELNMTHPSLTVNSLRLAHLAYRQSRNEQAHATPQPPVFNPASTEITYRKEYKQLILPAGLLSRITLDQPDYLYTGVLGWMIAQAIMPALDRPLPVDPHCLIRQYSRFGLDIAHTTLERDKIDNTALIFHAVSNVSLPGLAAWTPAQLFYIQFARSQCTKTLPHYNWTETSPNSYRVNIPLMNSAHFASTFQCKLGTWMHPKENCQIPHTKN